LPSSLKLRGGEAKRLLKKAMEPHLSAEVLYRRKMGFAVPVARWFRGPLRGSALADTGYFNARYLEQLVEQHDTGMRDHSAPIWALLMFEAFLRNSAQAGEGASALRIAV